MEPLFIYLMKMVLVSGALTGYYVVALRNRRFHSFNRGYLVITLLLSLALPLVHIPWMPFADEPLRGLDGHAAVAGDAGGGGARLHWLTATGVFVGIVSLLLLGICGYRIIQLYRLRARQGVCRMAGYDLIETDDPRAPFSFLHNLFWQQGADPDDPVNKKILSHELAHIGGRHSWDGLFVQLLACVFWMNPFFWIIRKELGLVHEFIADAATGMEGDTEGFARMLLQAMNGGRWLEPAQGFFQSPIKRRLTMISNNQRSGLGLLRKTLVLPVLAGVIIVVSCNKQQAASKPDALDQVKLEKEQMDLKTLKTLRLITVKGVPLNLSGMNPQDAKHAAEQLVLQTEKDPKKIISIMGKDGKPYIIKPQ